MSNNPERTLVDLSVDEIELRFLDVKKMHGQMNTAQAFRAGILNALCYTLSTIHGHRLSNYEGPWEDLLEAYLHAAVRGTRVKDPDRWAQLFNVPDDPNKPEAP